MHNNLHASVLQELDGAVADVFEVGGAGGDDVDDAEDALFGWGVGVVVVVVIVVVVVVVVVIVRGGVRVGMLMVVVVVMGMVMVMTVALMLMRMCTSTAIFLRMCLRMRSAFVFKPELGYRVSNDTSERAELSEGVPDAVLEVVGQAEHQSRATALDERDGGEEDEDGDDARSDGIPAGPAVVLGEEGGDDDGDGAEGIRENVEEDALHVFVVVRVAMAMVVSFVPVIMGVSVAVVSMAKCCETNNVD